MRDLLVLRVIAKLMIPFILLFALYVQMHGDFGPGGGFQAGVIFASAFILYALVFGRGLARRVAHRGIVTGGIALGVLMWIGVGVWALFAGGNFLEYGVIAHTPVEGQHLGIFLVELGVGVTVACTMIVIFFNVIERRQ